MLDLTRLLANQTDFQDTIATIQEGQGASIDGVWGSSCALVSAAISLADIPAQLIILPRSKQIDDFRDDLALFTDREVFAFPVLEIKHFKEVYKFGSLILISSPLIVLITSPSMLKSRN